MAAMAAASSVVAMCSLTRISALCLPIFVNSCQSPASCNPHLFPTAPPLHPANAANTAYDFLKRGYYFKMMVDTDELWWLIDHSKHLNFGQTCLELFFDCPMDFRF